MLGRPRSRPALVDAPQPQQVGPGLVASPSALAVSAPAFPSSAGGPGTAGDRRVPRGGQPSYAARVSSSSACAGNYSLPHADSAGTVLARAPRVGCRRRYTLRTRRCSPVCPRRQLLTQVEGGSSRTAVRRGVIAKGGAWGEEGRGTGRSRHTVPSGLVRKAGLPRQPVR